MMVSQRVRRHRHRVEDGVTSEPESVGEKAPESSSTETAAVVAEVRLALKNLEVALDRFDEVRHRKDSNAGER